MIHSNKLVSFFYLRPNIFFKRSFNVKNPLIFVCDVKFLLQKGLCGKHLIQLMIHYLTCLNYPPIPKLQFTYSLCRLLWQIINSNKGLRMNKGDKGRWMIEGEEGSIRLGRLCGLVDRVWLSLWCGKVGSFL